MWMNKNFCHLHSIIFLINTWMKNGKNKFYKKMNLDEDTTFLKWMRNVNDIQY